ncbi:MAG: methylcobamide--CoM methyltransferase [Deltaproteobacteria bacterium]|jgi:[methyl-Co(III) methanol-specific corrinoid protein]:coenzyme M methyltransferase|nr:methylcobamide--CoM methyltransferase [Deltaproteobacteria bacterium]
MGEFAPKERLIRTFKHQETDRPPVICPGGMMNSAVVEVMNKSGHTLPEAHVDAQLMEQLACDVHQDTQFENFGIPFCMTVEAEALGSEVSYGTIKCEPKVTREAFAAIPEVVYKEAGAIAKSPRSEAILQTIYHLSRKYPDVPVIGSLTGPLSTAASLVDPMVFLKQLYREKAAAHSLLEYISSQLLVYASLMVENGATAISIADPTATGEILGPKIFGEYALTYLNIIIDALHKLDVPVIVHICGDIKPVMQQVGQLREDALSVDAVVNLKKIKEEYPHKTTMGNLSTYLLEFGNTQKVYDATQALLRQGIDIIAPACGLSTSTPLDNITTFTRSIREA